MIYVGGTSYFGDAGNGVSQDEHYRSEPKGWGPYIAGSIDLAKQYGEQGYPVTIVYPTQIYGPTSWMEQLYLRPLYEKKPVTGLKGYDAYFSPIHIEDCSRACLHLIEHGKVGGNYILSDNLQLPSSEFRQEIERLMDVQDAKIRLVPRFLCQLALGPVLTEYATANTNFSNKKLLDTGFQLKYPDYKQGLPNVVQTWLAKQS
nr:NAD(P)-dependent oxidoreductase [Psychrobacillus sp.]